MLPKNLNVVHKSGIVSYDRRQIPVVVEKLQFLQTIAEQPEYSQNVPQERIISSPIASVQCFQEVTFILLMVTIQFRLR